MRIGKVLPMRQEFGILVEEKNMRNIGREAEKLLMAIILLLTLLIIPSALFGEEKDGKTEKQSKGKADFTLNIKDEVVSLKAKGVSLKEILEEIGREMNIEVVANISEKVKVSIKFDKLSVEKALEKLTTNYGYIMDSEKEDKKITKIIVIPEGGEKGGDSMAEHNNKNGDKTPHESILGGEPFKFEFDTPESMEEEE